MSDRYSDEAAGIPYAEDEDDDLEFQEWDDDIDWSDEEYALEDED